MEGLTAFAHALTAPDRHAPPGLAAHSERRFAVYRNNIAVGLIRALEIRFPALMAIVGEEFFRAMAWEFTLARPPLSPLLTCFGDDLPDFIAGFAPAEELPYLADISRIEIARTRAYHAPDFSRIGADAFSALTPAEFERMRIDLHPAISVIRSAHPVWTILAMASGWQPATALDGWPPQAVLVDRPELDAIVRPITAGAAIFLEVLGAGEPLHTAATKASQAPGFDLPATLATLIGERLATRIQTFDGDAS